MPSRRLAAPPPSFAPLALAFALAGAADAQSLTPRATPAAALRLAAAPLSPAAAALARTGGELGFASDDQGPILSPAPTAVDHGFAGARLVASAGFLCGLKSAPDNNGAASALGYDPHGRFVGARLSYAFR